MFKLLTRNTPTALRRAFAIQKRDVNEQDRTISLTFSSETNQVCRWDYELGGAVPEILLHSDGACDLSPVRDAGSVLRNHDPDQIVGVPVEVSIDPETKKGRAVIRFGNTQIARDAFQDVKDGILRGVSFGYEITAAERVKRGETSAAGIAGPALVATKWRVHEITLTPIPADSDVGVGRSQDPATAGKQGEVIMHPRDIRAMVRAAGLSAEFAEKCIKRGYADADELADAISTERSRAKTKRDETETEKEKKEKDEEKDEEDDEEVDEEEPVKAKAKAIKAERARVLEIQSACRSASLPEDVADDLIERGVSVPDACKVIVDKLGSREKAEGGAVSHGTRAEVGQERHEKVTRHIEASIAHSMRYAIATGSKFTSKQGAVKGEEDAAVNERVYEDYLASFKGVQVERRGLCELGRQWLELINFPGARSMGREQIAQAVFGMDAKFRAVAANGTASIVNILANVQNKVLLKTYKRAAPSWQKWCRIGSLPDFKPGSRLRLSDTADLKETAEGGEIFDSQITDEKETIQLANYARMASFTWQMFVNDDLDALATLTIRYGQAAMRLPARLVYVHLLSNPTMQDGVALFHASHSNLGTGGGSALAGTALNTAYAAIQKQVSIVAPNDTDQSPGDQLDLTPAMLMFPPELRNTAKKLIDPNLYVTEERFFSELQEINESRLSSSSTIYSGSSATAWYLIADPSAIDIMEVAFLDGDDQPRMQSMEDFNTLSMKTRIYLPCGVKALDYRGIYKANGA